MPDAPGEDRLQPLWEGQRLLDEKISSLAVLSEDSQAILQQVGERQALFVHLANDIAEMQKKLVHEMAGATGRVAEATGRVDSDASNAFGGGEDLMDFRPAEPEPGVSDSGPPIDSITSRYSERDQGQEELNVTKDVAWWHWALTSHSRSFHRKDLIITSEPMPRCGSVPPCKWLRLFAQLILKEPIFDYLVGLTILANAVCIGIEIDMELRGENNSTVRALEYFFISFYVLELSLHFVAHGIACLRNGWVFFDFVLVVLGCAGLFLVRPIVATLEESGGSDFTLVFDQIMMLRMVRFVRLARAMRIISFFKSLWKLVLGFIHSLNTIVSTFVFLALAIYMFACIGVELVTKDPRLADDSDVAAVVTENFSTLPSIMLTLIQFATLDSIAGIYYPLIMANPWLCLYFIPILLILSVAVMNLVTALIVEDALASTALDNESQALTMRRQLKKMIPVIKQVFTALDTSKDGCIQIPEIINNISRVQVQIPPELAVILTPDKLVDLFDFLDLDGSGELSEVEFVDGVCHLALMTVPVETTQILQLLRHHRREMCVVRKDLMQLKKQSTIMTRSASREPLGNWSPRVDSERPTPRGATMPLVAQV